MTEHTLLGAAWGAPISRVEVQIDGGPWRAATLDRPRERSGFAWRFWHLDWGTPHAGSAPSEPIRRPCGIRHETVTTTHSDGRPRVAAHRGRADTVRDQACSVSHGDSPKRVVHRAAANISPGGGLTIGT